MNLIQSFKDSFIFEGQKLRVNGDFSCPWFCGKDVAKILGYSNPNNAIACNIDHEDKTYLGILITKVSFSKGYPTTYNKNELKTIYINDSGLYCLILRSKLPSAKKFKK